MAGPGTPSAPTVITPTPAGQHRRLVEHPGRVAIVITMLAVVIGLVAVGLQRSDTDTRAERIYPTAVETVTPRPGELIRPQDTDHRRPARRPHGCLADRRCRGTARPARDREAAESDQLPARARQGPREVPAP